MVTEKEIVHKAYCVLCLGETNLVRNAKKETPYKITQYYICRTCNTEKLKKYRSTEHGMSRVREAVYKSIAKYPEKQNARLKLHRAIRQGKVIRATHCEQCKEKCKTEAHHTDYQQPLVVTWLCRNCHSVV